MAVPVTVTAPAPGSFSDLSLTTDPVSENLRRWLKFCGYRDGAVFEFQAFKVPGRYKKENRFAHAIDTKTIIRLAREAERFECPGVYTIVNDPEPEVATRVELGKWHVLEKGESTTNSDIGARRVLYIDFDWKRPKNTSTTDEQLVQTLAVSEAAVERIARSIEPSSVGTGMSGNGGAVFVALDLLPESEELHSLIVGIVYAVKFTFEAGEIVVDTSVTDAKRVGPVFGTTKRKGVANLAERPHRQTYFHCADDVRRVGIPELRALLVDLRATLTPEQNAVVDKEMKIKPAAKATAGQSEAATPKRKRNGTGGIFDRANECPIRDVLSHIGRIDGDTVLCPGCGESFGDTSVAIVGNGVKCSHGRCAGKGQKGFFNAVDAVMAVRGCTNIEAVRQLGEWFGFKVRDEGYRAITSHSPLSAYTIIHDNIKGVLDGKRLEFNEMAWRTELGRKPLQDTDASRIRVEIERRLVGGIDKNGNSVGLKLSIEDVRAAVDMVARENAFHPVRAYLRSVKWDGVPRIDAALARALAIEPTPLNLAMLRCWLISAVARPISPGTKVDTVVVFVGPQGHGKSTAFKKLAGEEWFTDTAFDIGSKDAFMQISAAWIVEWSEMEAMRRAREVSSAKAFLTSATDKYRPPWGRYTVEVPRSCIIVGSTNETQFLTDETGNRRFWPLPIVRKIDTAYLEANRDAIWAEAVALHDAGEKWWLTGEQEQALGEVHANHKAPDVWTDRVLTYAESHLVEFTTADVLESALGMPPGQWKTGEARRVVTILREAGWSQPTNKPKGKSKPWIRPVPDTDAGQVK